MVAFYAMRFALAIFSARGDAFLTRECLKIEPKVGATVLLVATFGTGNYVASTSMLPNSFAMGCVTRAVASSIKYLNFRATRERFGEVVVKEEMKKKKKEKVSDDEKEEEDDEVVIERNVGNQIEGDGEGVHVVRYWRFNRMAVRRYSVRSNWRVVGVDGGRDENNKSDRFADHRFVRFSLCVTTFFYGGFSNGFSN